MSARRVQVGADGADGAGSLSVRDLAVLRQVSELRLMSARQIEVEHFPTEQHASAYTAARTCRRVLERLVRHGLLARLERRVGGLHAGSAGFIYQTTARTQRALGEDGPRRRYREPSAAFVTHTLAVGQLVVDLHTAARGGRFEIVALQTEPRCWRAIPGTAGLVLRPDLYVTVGVGAYEYSWWVEVDLGTESLPALLRKCDTYDRAYRAGVREAHDVFPRVAWLMHNPGRVERLRSGIGRRRGLLPALFDVELAANAISVLTDQRRTDETDTFQAERVS
jgi:hypothetical protein